MIRYVLIILLFAGLRPMLQAQEATHVIPDHIVRKVSPSVVAIQHRRAGGSGFVISADGYILTNGHVVTRNDPEFPMEAEESITVILDDERKYPAEVLGFSLDPDVALLKIDPDDPLTPVQFADSRAVTTGQKCFAVGTPVGLKRTFTSGILSNVERADLGTFTKVLQTDAAINQGNSGGPLFDENGRVIGLNTYARRGANNLGFTVPAHVAVELKDHFIEHGRFVRSGLWFCILGEIYDELAEALNVEAGVLVRHVEPGTPVAQAGLLPGDVIVAIDGEPCAARTHAEFLDVNWDLATRAPGTVITVSILRGKTDRQPVELQLTLKEFDKIPRGGLQPGNLTTYSYNALGIGYREIVLLKRIYANLPDTEGVLAARVDDNSAAKDADIRTGDIITHVGDEVVSGLDSFEDILEDRLAKRDPVIPIRVRRGSHVYRSALAPRYELNGKSAAVLVSAGGFAELELLRRELLADGVAIHVHHVEPGSFNAEDIDAATTDIVLLCSEDDDPALANNDAVLTVIRAANEKERVLAAVGASSLALVKADPKLLEKKITTSAAAAGEALELGATYTGKDVETDEKIVTSTGRNRRVIKTFVEELRKAAR